MASCILSPDNKHLAAINIQGFNIFNLPHTSAPPQFLATGGDDPGIQTRICWSIIHPHRLAASHGDDVMVWNALNNKVDITLPGQGRAVTAVTFGGSGGDWIAISYIDGTIQLHDLNAAGKMVVRFNANEGTCHAVGFSPADGRVFASASAGKVHFWDVGQPLNPFRTITTNGGRVVNLEWNRHHPSKFMTGHSSGWIKVWKVLSKCTDGRAGGENDSVLDPLPEIEERPMWERKFETTLALPTWLGMTGVLVVDSEADKIRLYNIVADESASPSSWETKTLEKPVMDFGVEQSVNGSAHLVIISGDEVSQHSIPQDVLDSIGWRPIELPVTETATDTSVEVTSNTMRTIPISVLRLHRSSSFARTSRQLRRQRSPTVKLHSWRLTPPLQAIEPSPAITATRQTDSLELPKYEDDESSIPFLSPSIPARKASSRNTGNSNQIALLHESSVKSPHLPPSSLPTTKVASFGTNHSDHHSDDGSIASVVGSVMLMPGGVNVPLPKTCGALFSTNGQLLTFFPPKPPEPIPAGPAKSEEYRIELKSSQARGLLRMFPSFGKLGHERRRSDSGSEISGWSKSSDAFEGRLTVAPPSWPTSYHSEPSPIKPIFTDSEPRLRISVSELDDILPARATLATRYKVFLNSGESAFQLCEHNAAVAESAGLCGAASLWRLVALILEDAVPLSVLSSSTDHEPVLVIARRALSLMRSDSGEDLTLSIPDEGKLGWTHHPFGSHWLIREVFQHLEYHSDTQSLAIMSAVLSELDKPMSEKADRAMAQKLPAYQPDYFSSEDVYRSLHTRNTLTIIPQIPLWLGNLIHESPVDLHGISYSSSRANSPPQTPHFETASGSLTPPWSLANPLTRQASRLSASGSGSSPEHDRPCFNVTAEHYAQSITHKFASYGTSPPAKRFMSTSHTPPLGLSTSAPGLSTSFGNRGLFDSATITTTGEESQLSRSLPTHVFAAEDDDDDTRTSDESSISVAPRSPMAGVSLRLFNQSSFDREARIPLLSTELQQKGHVWRALYADTLRCWGLPVEAAEMEKISGLARLAVPDVISYERQCVEPVTGHYRKPICGFCVCVITGLYQYCTSCGHTSHFGCLVDRVDVQGGDDYLCASGCSDLPLVETLWEIGEGVRPHKPDGRRWSEGVER